MQDCASTRRPEENSRKKVAIVGGGLVGALNACFFGRRGYDVTVYEYRGDLREAGPDVKGRSINLALSTRGRAALHRVQMEQTVVQTGVPMYARMIHDRDGRCREIAYGRPDQYILSIDRRKLNEVLLSEADKFENVKQNFHHKLVSCDLDKGRANFQRPDGSIVTCEDSLIVGCDGAFSAVRREMMKKTRFNFSQRYIEHGYMELRIPARPDGSFAMKSNYLHIWPRNTFMMIALPDNKDNSFVVTLFMPFRNFQSITSAESLLTFFRTTFPDSLPLIGEKELVTCFLAGKPLPLISIKCSPYNIAGKAVIMGDAAHAMVPFYGQGMNSGFEDCLLLDELLDRHRDCLDAALEEYTAVRVKDAEAINDLAMKNYIEMRASVNSPWFLIRKSLDRKLNRAFPGSWIPLYSMVSFTQIPYHRCIADRDWQDRMLSKIGAVLASGLVVSVAVAGLSVLSRDKMELFFRTFGRT